VQVALPRGFKSCTVTANGTLRKRTKLTISIRSRPSD
jgi:hypothetical protein